MSTIQTAPSTRPWVSHTDEAWVIGWDESVLLSGPIDEPDERTRAEIRVALAEAGLEVPADRQAVLDLHEETIYGPQFRYLEI